eukprot:Awhi_evm1s5030
MAAPVPQRNSPTEADLGGVTDENSFDKRAENVANVNINDDLDLKDNDHFYNIDFAYDIDMPYDEEDFFTKVLDKIVAPVATKIDDHNNDADLNDDDGDGDGNNNDNNDENDEDEIDDDERFFYLGNALKTGTS